MLFSWIYEQYSLSLKLEIGNFIQTLTDILNQELQVIINKSKDIQKYGNSLQTKPMEGIALHIALTILREKLPNKYIFSHINNKNQKVIIIENKKF